MNSIREMVTHKYKTLSSFSLQYWDSNILYKVSTDKL